MFGKVFGYIRKNFLYIFPFVLIGGALLACLFDYGAFDLLMGEFYTGRLGEVDFFLFFRTLSILNFSSWYYALISLAFVFGLGIVLSMELAFIEKHMRIGKRTLNGLWGKINDNILPSFTQILIYLSIYELWALITSAVLYAIVSIFRTVIVAQYILAVGIFLLFTYVLLYIVHIFYLWLPCAEITGFTFYESLKYSTQLVGKIRKEVIGGFILHLLLCAVILFGVAAIDVFVVKIPVTVYIVAGVLCVYLFTIFTISQEVFYFETDQLERADLKRPY